MKNLILAIDQGTTGTTALLMDTKGKVLGSHNQEFPQIFPQEGWVEHNPQDILASVQGSIEKVLEKTSAKASQILSIGITNQRETVVFWDRKTGKPLGNAIVWQCRRTAKRTEQLKAQRKEASIQRKTGLPLDPYFSSTKIEWFLKNNKNKNLVLGTIDTFLLWNLTGGKSFFTEPSNASRTQLYNLRKSDWDQDLIKMFKAKREFLPEVVDSNSEFGVTKGFAPLLDGTPITGILGDQQAALFGQGAFKTGEAKVTFGTGSFILFNTGSKLVPSKKGLLTTVAWKLHGKETCYALEGGAFNCGSAVQWLRDQLQIIGASPEVEDLARSARGFEETKLVFVPALSGLGAPFWKPNARGALLGLSRGTTRADVARATLEGLSFQNAAILKAMEGDLGKSISKIYVDGGAARNNFFMELQADHVGRKLIRPQHIETTAMGAAMMAGLGASVWKSPRELLEVNPEEQSFRSSVTKSKRDKKFADYERAFKLIAGW